MLTTCPTCETAYTIPDDRIGPKGRKVRCTKCGDEWRIRIEAIEAEPAPAPEPIAPPPAPEPAQVAAPRSPSPSPPPEDDWNAALAETEAEAEAKPEVAHVEEHHPAPKERAAAVAEAAEALHAEGPAKPAMPVRIRVKRKRRGPIIDISRLRIGIARATPFAGPFVFACACIAVAVVILARTAIVAAAPDLAGLYASLGLEVNLRGLVFDRIETLREVDNGQPVLVVEGTISNKTTSPRSVPAVRFALRDADNQELYAWAIEPKSDAVAPGESIRFRTRLAAPPDQAADIQVRFIERRNHQAGL